MSKTSDNKSSLGTANQIDDENNYGTAQEIPTSTKDINLKTNKGLMKPKTAAFVYAFAAVLTGFCAFIFWPVGVTIGAATILFGVFHAVYDLTAKKDLGKMTIETDTLPKNPKDPEEQKQQQKQQEQNTQQEQQPKQQEQHPNPNKASVNSAQMTEEERKILESFGALDTKPTSQTNSTSKPSIPEEAKIAAKDAVTGSNWLKGAKPTQNTDDVQPSNTPSNTPSKSNSQNSRNQ